MIKTPPPVDIAVLAICFNESFMLPYFIRHYKRFSKKIIVYDNCSTDQSVQIMKENGVHVESFGSNQQTRDDIMLNIKNHAWKILKGKADWAIVVDIDEFVHHPNLLELLKNAKDNGVTVMQPAGYNMFCDKMPVGAGQLYQEVRLGVADAKYNKICVLNLNLLENINYGPGCHQANPMTRQRLKIYTEANLRLLHFNYLTLEYHLQRYKERGQRLSQINRRNQWGTEYLLPAKTLEANYKNLRKKARPILT